MLVRDVRQRVYHGWLISNTLGNNAGSHSHCPELLGVLRRCLYNNVRGYDVLSLITAQSSFEINKLVCVFP